MTVAIIGGGAAGLMCGAILALNGKMATIFDGNEKVGKKLYITGKGRCNLTNLCTPSEFLENLVRGRKFMSGAINKFSSFDCKAFFEENGLKLKVERGNRVFPESDKASDVIKTLQKLNESNEICLDTFVQSVEKKGDKFILKTSAGQRTFDRVVVATGGKSYPATGSRGQGYEIAKKFGHSVSDLKPALTAIELGDKYISSIQGLPLKNVEIVANFDCEENFAKKLNPLSSVTLSQKKGSERVQARIFGEALFTDIGITGPIVLTLSSIINRGDNVEIYLDLKPALTPEQLDKRLLRDFEASQNKNLSYIIKGLLPKNLVEIFLDKNGLDGEKKVNSVTKQERAKIIDGLKHFTLDYIGLYPLESGVVTSGGVALDEISPISCQSKLVQGLYFIGEVLDIDCLTGGFNLQTAFSTAYICACDLIKQS